MLSQRAHNFKVTKRDGSIVPLQINEIIKRIKKLCEIEPKLNISIDEYDVSMNIIKYLNNGIKTSMIDSVTALYCESLVKDDYEYGELAARLLISDHHKNIELECGSLLYSDIVDKLYNNVDNNGVRCSLISEAIYKYVMENKDEVNKIIDINRDYLIDYFGFKTLYTSYLLKLNKGNNTYFILECPQHLFMRVAFGIHINNGENFLERVKETYELMSMKYFTHATPTLFNAGTPFASNLSCFLYTLDDSITGIFKGLGDTAQISKWSGGIGISISDIRAKGSYIRKTGGVSDGIGPMLKLYNDTALYVNQSGKRNGSIAVYIEPWHADIFTFLDAKRPTGVQETKSRDLYYALWIPDLFMLSVKEKKKWYLMCPSECPGLTEKYGLEFEELYMKYVNENKYKKEINAIDLWNEIINSQIITGVPYIAFKDTINKKSNHKNIGTIKNSNLCVAGYTRILTKSGYYMIKDLENQEIEIWNGKTWSKTIPKKTGTAQKLLTISCSNGTTLHCTPYHKFYLKNGEMITAQDLKIGYSLLQHELPNDIINHTGYYNDHNNYQINTQKIVNVPINKNKSIKELWFKNQHPLTIIENDQYKLSHHNKFFLIDISLMLQTMGYYSSITYNSDSKNWILKTSKKYMDVYVTNIMDENIIEDTYCFNEPLEHKGMFEGILTGNCIEIMEYSDTTKYACCVLSSIVLPTFVEGNNFNYNKLEEVTKVIVRNLNIIIDINNYPTIETKTSNMSERPLGIGVQGLADVFYKLKIPFESDQAKNINSKIFETIYYAALCESNELAKIHGSYSTFPGSPFSQGKFQFDLWKENNHNYFNFIPDNKWNILRDNIIKYGIRNSMLTALMPTASTSQIMGSVESFEPISSNLYTRRTSAGEFVVINKYLIKDLMNLNLWNDNIKNKLIKYRGSIQNIKEIPDNLKELYKTCYEIKQKELINLAIIRGMFIDQSQSLNLFFKSIDYSTLSNALFYGHSKGLKTGSYYIRTESHVKQESLSSTLNNIDKNDDNKNDNDKNNDDKNNDDKNNNKNENNTLIVDDKTNICEMCSS